MLDKNIILKEKLKAKEQEAWGLSNMVVGGGFMHYSDKIKSSNSAIIWLGAAILSLIGIIQVIMSWFSTNKANNLELKSTNDITLQSPAQSAGIDASQICCIKNIEEKPKFLINIQPKTLTEYAQHTTSKLER